MRLRPLVLALAAALAPGCALLPLPAGQAAAATAIAPDAAPTASPAGLVVLIGTGGLSWEDAGPETAALQTYLDLGSTGHLAVRSVEPSTCPVDGWLAVSAGRRAADAPVTTGGGTSSCRAPGARFGVDGGPATVPDWLVYREQAARESFDAVPGSLGRALADAGRTSAAVGPGAVIALADENGRAPHAWPGLGDGYQTLTLSPGQGDSAGLASDVAAALATDPDVLVVDVGGIRDVREDLVAAPGTSGAASPRDEQAAILDDRISTVTDAMPGGATVFVASTYDSGTEPRLRLLAAAGDDYVSSLLSSRSTQQAGLAQTTDLLPTVVGLAGAPVPATAVGSRIRAVAAGGTSFGRYQKLTDLDRAATAMHEVVPVFFGVLIGAQLVLYALVVAALRTRGTRSPGTAGRARLLTLLELLAVFFAAVPAASFLANLLPWWRSDRPGLAVTTDVLVVSLAVAAIAMLGPWRRRLLGPMGIVGGFTALVLAADAITGSHLVLSSLMGVQPVVAGRFYGFSNPGFALFATGALLAAVSLADWLVARDRRRAAWLSVAGIGLLATVVDGAPGLGADFGGPPAIISAFAVLAMMIAGVRVTWRRAVLIGVVSVLVVTGIAALDWLRPVADQTHLGRFVQTVLDGGLWSVVWRKLGQNLQILFSSPLSALLPLAALFVVLVLARPARWGARPLQSAYDRAPVLRSGMAAFGVLIAIGFAINDSGAVVPAVAAMVALPLLVAASAAVVQQEDEERAAAPPRRPVRNR